MKSNIIFILVGLFQFFFISNNFGQLYISANAGAHALKIVDSNSDSPVFLINPENNYLNNLSVIVGLNVKYKFKKNVFCSALAFYSKKDIEASGWGIAPSDRFTFNYFKYCSGLGIYLRRFEFFFGCEYNQLKQIKKFRGDQFADKLYKDVNELAVLYRLSYQIWKTQISLNYHNGINFSDKKVTASYFKPLNSISIDIGYLLSIKKLSFKKNVIDCPKI